MSEHGKHALHLPEALSGTTTSEPPPDALTPRTRAGRLLLGKNLAATTDPAIGEWLLNDILAIEREAEALSAAPVVPPDAPEEGGPAQSGAAARPGVSSRLPHSSGERCQLCGAEYATVYRVPDEVWAEITPGRTAEGGLLCPRCADGLAFEAGYSLFWTATIGGWAAPVVERGLDE